MSYIGNSPVYQAFVTDSFSGNGSTVAFTLSYAPANTASIIVQIDAGLQLPTAYSVVGTVLTMSEAPPAGTTLFVRYLGVPASNVVTTAYRSVTELTATAGQTSFTVSSYVPGFINVMLNGVRLGSADFTATDGVTVVLAVGANAGDLLIVESFYVSSVINAIQAVSGSVTATYLAAGAAYQAFLDVASSNGTGAMRLPVGTTAQRPTGQAGLIRQNSTTGNPEWFDTTTSTWLQFSQPAGYTVNYLVVAGGGGGGGSYGAGGGGGGGMLPGSVTLNSGTAYTITVGAGGAGAAAASRAAGVAGSNSSISSIATAIGGGRGAGDGIFPSPGGSGGSGGGAATNSGTAGGSGTAGQGYAGGNAQAGTGAYGGGGGGGASAAGSNGISAGNGGNGGAGASSSISGSSVTYAGGGGGSGEGSIQGTGGAGGGGNAGAPTGLNGTANLGGGGGAGGGSGGSGSGGAGGSGIVIISYLGSQRGTGGTVTSSGGYTIHTFTSSGTYNA